MSALALELIAKAKAEKWTYLDLGRCGLVTLPRELFELVELEELILSDAWWDNEAEEIKESINGGASNQLSYLDGYWSVLIKLRKLVFENQHRISDLSPLTNLTALKVLNCTNTSISDLSPLANLTNLQELYCSDTSITDLNPLANLTALQELDCARTLIIDLSPLANLTALKDLYCSTTSITDLSPMANLVSLKKFHCLYTLVKDLSPLANLTTLQEFDCSRTLVIDLSPLANLTALRTLDCKSETITHIPKHILFLPQLRSIFFSPTVRNIPPGLTELKDIRAYFRHLEQEISPAPDQLFKVVLLGNGCVGKTSLLARLEHGQAATLPTLEARTHAIQMKQWPVPQSELVANVWDFGGQEIYHATHRLFLASRALYLVLWSGEHVREAGEAYYDLPYWLDLILAEGRHNRVLVIQNRFGDEPTQLPPDWHDLVAYYEARHLVLERPLSVDCCQNEGLEQVRKQIRRSLEDMQEQRAYQLPAAWVGIRAHLLAEREDGTKVLPFSAFRAQYQALGMDDAAAHALLQFLHHNGIVYHQSHRLNDDIILNQQ